MFWFQLALGGRYSCDYINWHGNLWHIQKLQLQLMPWKGVVANPNVDECCRPFGTLGFIVELNIFMFEQYTKSV
jgi:hypothetical protein